MTGPNQLFTDPILIYGAHRHVYLLAEMVHRRLSYGTGLFPVGIRQHQSVRA